MANAQGLGQAVGSGGMGHIAGTNVMSSAPAANSMAANGGYMPAMAQGMSNPQGFNLSSLGQAVGQHPMQGVGGSPQPMGVNMPQSVQRMPGGFGLSPQMLQMIAHLQQRAPQFAPGQVPPKFGAFGGGYAPAQNPYAQSPQNFINARGGTMGR